MGSAPPAGAPAASAVPAQGHPPGAVTPLTAAALARHLAAGHLEAHFQPVVALPSRQVIGFEALARLRNGGLLLPPPAFVPTAGDHIPELGSRMLELALAGAAGWRAGPGPLSTATVAVNVSPAQLAVPTFVPEVREGLARHGVPPQALVLEIVESAATSDEVRPQLERLASLGVRMALDDFGVGFANLDHLRRLPVQTIKIDRSFVTGVGRRGPERSIVRVVLELADSLGLSVVAEGVETEAQEAALLRLGCRNAQGFLFAAADPSPDRAAAAVRPGGRPVRKDSTPVPGGPLPAAESRILAAATLLGHPADRGRAAAAAVAGDLARRLALPEAHRQAAVALALVPDASRLALDGHPVPLLADPPGSGAASTAGVLSVGAAVASVAATVSAAATGAGRAFAPEELRAALLDTARTDLPPGWGAALAAMAGDPPAIAPLSEVLDELHARRLGKRDGEDRLRSLVGVSRVLASTRDTRELLRVALEESRRIAGAASAALERWERESGVIRTLINVGDLGPGEEPFPSDETYPLDRYDGANRALLSGLPVIATRDDADDLPGEVELLHTLQKGSMAAVPLVLEDRIWGQLWFSTSPGHSPFRHADLELLTAVATLMSGVVAQAENLDRVARLAFEDPLTRVANRRAVDDALAALATAGRAVTVALVDVDGLKEVNDRHGHQRGDELICAVADALSTVAAGVPGALVGRLGGDEFCLVAPGTDRAGAHRELTRAAADCLRGAGASFSFGLATGTPSWTPRVVLQAADVELYQAKAARRRPPGRALGG
ncbi:MAG: EAL domain-containing protein [Kineosporiaceae bacterium]